MTVLAVIPARGGSKGIPGKNIANLGGRPLIAWTIEAARSSRLIDRVLVSTDDTAIADVARMAGAEVPFLRSAELSGDNVPSLPVVRHALDFVDGLAWRPDEVVLLQPTSPFRSGADIDACIEMRRSHNASASVSVVECHCNPAWSFRINGAGRLESCQPEDMPLRRQDLSPIFRPNGAIYVVLAQVIRDGGSWYGSDTCAYLMPEERSLDIDTPWHLRLARLIAAA